MALRSQIAFCQTSPLSVAVKIALAKMVMLPRLLYYFKNLPFKYYFLASKLQCLCRWLGSLHLEETATTDPAWSRGELFQCFCPISHSRPPTPRLTKTAHHCFYKSLRITRSTTPYATASFSLTCCHSILLPHLPKCRAG